MRWLLLLLVGLVGGFLSGLFGVGGGIIMVPLLTTLVRLDHRQAAATSLAAIVPTAIAGSVTYFAGGAVNVLAGALIGAGGVAGSIVGTRLLRKLPVSWLRWLFLVLLAVVAVRTTIQTPTRGSGMHIDVLVGAGLVVLGLAMGVASGLFGIGGGVLAVPVLIAVFGADDLLAKGTSLAAMILTALAGTIFNQRAGLVRPVDGLVVGFTAVAASFGGVALAFRLSPLVASVLFAVLIAFSAAQLVVAAIREWRTRRRVDPDEAEAPAE